MMFKLNIVTPNKRLLTDADVEQVFVPAYMGELNILPGHAPLVSTLSEGVLKYQLQGQSDLVSVAISWGYLEVTPTSVNILAETAETKEDIDLARAQATLKNVEAAMGGEIQGGDLEKFDRKRRRAEARIEVAQS